MYYSFKNKSPLEIIMIDKCPITIECIKKIIYRKYKSDYCKIRVYQEKDPLLQSIVQKKIKPNLIMIDWDTADFKVFDFITKIKEWSYENNFSIPVLLITATYKPIPAHYSEYLDGILIKPFLISQIAHKIDQEISHHLKINELLTEYPIFSFFKAQA